jgi:hypothetical protein
MNIHMNELHGIGICDKSSMVTKSWKQITAIVNNHLQVPCNGLLMLTSYNTKDTKLNQFAPWNGSFQLSQNPNWKNHEHLDSKHDQNLRVKTIDDQSQYWILDCQSIDTILNIDL